MQSIENNISTFVNLIKNGGLELSQEKESKIDAKVKTALKSWITDNNFPTDIPLSELGLDTCIIGWFDRKVKIFIFQLYYDGSATGTDPCGGYIVFSFDGSQANLLLNSVQCAD